MSRRLFWRGLFVVLTLLGIGWIYASSARAHECTDANNDGQFSEQECGPSKVWGGWRPNFIPLFDYPSRDDTLNPEGSPVDEDERRTYQRWRDEYGCHDSMCIWARPNASVAEDGSPRSLHAGIAADHSFTEGFHASEGHQADEDNHDTHGGTIYADVCLAEDTHYTGAMRDVGCTDANDTEVGVVIVDHLDCTFGCQDEYHIIRPLDTEYTQAQIDQLSSDVQYDIDHPDDWLCGYDGYGSSCPLPDTPD